MLLDVAYVGNRPTDLLLVANYNQAAPNNAAGTIPLAARRPIPTFGDITYVFNGGKSRYDAFQMKYEWRMGARRQLLSSLTLSKAQDNGAGSLENQNGNFPAPQDINNLAADYGVVGLQPAVQQHHELRVVAAVRQGQALGRQHVAGDGPARGRLADRRHQHHHARRDGHVHLLAGGGVPGVGRSRTTSPAPTTTGPTSRAIRTRAAGHAVDHQLVQHGVRVAADRSEPAVRQRGAQHRPRTELLADRHRGVSKNVALGGPTRSCRCGSRRSTCSTASTSWRRRRIAAPRRSARSRRPTTRGRCSSA